MLDLNSQAKRGLDQDVKGRGPEYDNVTLVVTSTQKRDYLVSNVMYLCICTSIESFLLTGLIGQTDDLCVLLHWAVGGEH